MQANQTRGFTLTELLAAMAVLGATLALALPTYSGIVEESQATRAANQFHALLSVARVHAVQRGIKVTVCRSGDLQHCAYSGAWSAGAMVFEDINMDGDRSANEKVIAAFETSDSAPYHVVGPHNRPTIAFNPDGRSAGTNLSLRVCNRKLDVVRVVIVSASGRPRTTRDVQPGARCGADPNPVT